MSGGCSPIMLCNVIKVSHPLLVNHSDGGVKLSVHHWQSDVLAAASSTLGVTFFFLRWSRRPIRTSLQRCLRVIWARTC